MTSIDHAWADEGRVDEVDVALIDALHVSPRASFAQLGEALGVSAVTVGRRWRRLTSAGKAWVSSVPGPSMPLTGAVMEVECEPGRIEDVAHRLARLPQVFSVHVTSGTLDLYALVVAVDAAALARLLLDEIGKGVSGAGGVRRVRSAMVTALFSGAQWRLGALDADATETLSSSTVGGGRSAREEVTGFDQRLFRALQEDGRATYRELSKVLDRPDQVIRRRLDHLVRTGVLEFRTDFVRPEGGWSVHVVLSLRVPDELVGEVGCRIGGWSETRVCAAVIAAANLFVTVQLHELAALNPFVRRIRSTWPGVEVVDRRAVLRSVKSWGRILDMAGRSVVTIPVDPWA